MRIGPEMAVYKNKASKKPLFSVASSKFNGDSTNESKVEFNVHTGTHVDFPRHIYNEGKTSLSFDPTTFLRDVVVLDLMSVKAIITVDDLKKHVIHPGDFLFFKTRNSAVDEFLFDFVYLSHEAALYLRDLGISGVGIDALGIEREQKGHPTHKTLIDHDIWIIEGLRLREVPAGTYSMIALPFLLEDVDALPLTVVLQAK